MNIFRAVGGVTLSLILSMLSILFFYDNIDGLIIHEKVGLDISSSKIAEIHQKQQLTMHDLELIDKEAKKMRAERGTKRKFYLDDPALIDFYETSQGKYFWILLIWASCYFFFKGGLYELYSVVLVPAIFFSIGLFSLVSFLIITIIVVFSFLVKKKRRPWFA